LKAKINIFILSVIISVFIVLVASGLLYSAYQQRERIKDILSSVSLDSIVPVLLRNDYKSTKPGDVDPIGEIQITVEPNKEIANVSRLIYGSNLSVKVESEWDVIAFLKNIGVTCFRFLGGTQGYHWKTGGFDFDEHYDNAPLRNIDHVIEFSKIIGAQLVLQVNVESGTAKEAAEWVEYMNKKSGYRVDYWELGNEVYGDWDKGYMTANRYAEVIKEFSREMKKVDPTIKIGMDWAPMRKEEFNMEVIKKAGEYIDFVSCHWYPNHTNPTHKFESRIHPTPNEVMSNYLQIPIIVNRIHELIAKYAPSRTGKIEVTFLEWDGAWDGPNSDFKPYSKGITQWSLANALFHADCLGQFALNKVTVAAHYDAQSINFGLIRGWDKDAGYGGYRWDGEIVRPKAYAIQLFSKYFGDIVVGSTVKNSPSFYKKHDWWADSYYGNVPYISCYASKFSSEKKISLILINKHADKDYKVRVKLIDIQPDKKAVLHVLTGPDPMSQNEQNPDQVRIHDYTVENVNKDFRHTIPAHSVNVIIFTYS
jgi:alpha-N-arabinofuranosidase